MYVDGEQVWALRVVVKVCEIYLALSTVTASQDTPTTNPRAGQHLPKLTATEVDGTEGRVVGRRRREPKVSETARAQSS